jgi:dTMP kinase
MSRGRLLTIEGIDGVGKTTHAALVADYLREHGLLVRTFREPGGTELGERLRHLIKDGAARSPLAELLLFAASRAELVANVLKPALQENCFIVLDRFTDSTFAYQGALKQIPEDILDAICRAAADGLVPDLTFWLDLDPADALNRRYPLAQALVNGGSAPGTRALPGAASLGAPPDSAHRRRRDGGTDRRPDPS